MLKLNLKEKKGITLVALIITIIVLLILAGVTLNIVLNGGIINKSENAVAKYQDTSGNETDQINYLDAIFGNFLANVTGASTSGDNNQGGNNQNEPSTPGTDNTSSTTHTKLGSGAYSYQNPVIPAGFKTVETTDASWALEPNGAYVDDWNDGLVIEDNSGNQFVWVPVDGSSVNYQKYYSIGSTYTLAYLDGSSVTEANVASMVSSSNYGGFYIGRYEAGIPDITATATARTTATVAARSLPTNSTDAGIAPVVKRNQIPWNYISFANAKKNAESLYTGTNVKSILITDNMWDATMKWLSLSTDPKTGNNVNVDSNCKDWGNYNNAPVENVTEYSTDEGASWPENTATDKTKGTSTSWLLKTGLSDYTKRKNIYDLAGNLWEYTDATLTNGSSTSYAIRGGFFYYDGTSYVAAYRYYYHGTGGYDVGFRVALYIQ